MHPLDSEAFPACLKQYKRTVNKTDTITRFLVMGTRLKCNHMPCIWTSLHLLAEKLVRDDTCLLESYLFFLPLAIARKISKSVLLLTAECSVSQRFTQRIMLPLKCSVAMIEDVGKRNLDDILPLDYAILVFYVMMEMQIMLSRRKGYIYGKDPWESTQCLHAGYLPRSITFLPDFVQILSRRAHKCSIQTERYCKTNGSNPLMIW